jgi:hypothetical protein
MGGTTMGLTEPPSGTGPGDATGEQGGGLWLDEPTPAGPPDRGVPRRVAALVALMAVLALVAVPVGLALASGHAKPVSHQAVAPTTTATTPVSLGTGPAEDQVLSALSATTDSGSFDVAYTLVGTPGQSTTPSTQCYPIYPGMGPGGAVTQFPTESGRVAVYSDGTIPAGSTPSTTCQAVANTQSARVTGSGTIDVSPKAMVVSAAVNSSLDVSVRLDQNDVWESGGADYGLTPTGSTTSEGPGQPLSGFASLVEGTLGSRAGAVAMIGMASPAGYLDLEQESVTGAAETGPGTVDGTPVTFYQVAVDPARLETMAGLSADEVATLKAAVGVLQGEGYTGTTVKVGIDGAGFIRQATSTAAFSDGGTVVLDASFTKFGCAGIVLMPGASAGSTTTQPCASDVPTTTAPTPTTVGGAVSTTSTEPTTTSTEPTTTSTSSTTSGGGGSTTSTPSSTTDSVTS